MLILSIFLVLTLSTLVAMKLLNFPLNLLPPHSSPPRSVMGMITLCGVGLIVFNGLQVEHGMLQKKWPTLPGRVITAVVSDDSTCVPDITYSYESLGVTYTGRSDLQVPYFGGKSSRREVAYKTIMECRQHPVVTVYVNPENAAISTLKPGPRWDQFTRLSLGALVYMLGIGGLISVGKN